MNADGTQIKQKSVENLVKKIATLFSQDFHAFLSYLRSICVHLRLLFKIAEC
jgi:hypothetical protein